MRALYLTLTLLLIVAPAASQEAIDPIADLNKQVNVNRGHILALEDAVQHQAAIDDMVIGHADKTQKQIEGLIKELDRLRLLVVDLEAEVRRLQDDPETLQ